MKKILLSAAFAAAAFFCSIPTQAQTKFKVVTSIESVVPGGTGRSRMIENSAPLDYESLKAQDKVKRAALKIDQTEYSETKMLNFFSGVGINFQNVASNDALITSMLNEMTAKVWKLYTIVNGFGVLNKGGIFITRYIFEKN